MMPPDQINDLIHSLESAAVYYETAETFYRNSARKELEEARAALRAALSGSPQVEAGMVRAEFNINEHVYVKMTDFGWKAFSDHWAQFGCHDVKVSTDANGWSKFQLWELMSVFGSSLSNGSQLPFETKIRLSAHPPLPADGWKDMASAPRDGSYVLGFGPHKTRGTYIDVIHFWREHWTVIWMEGFGEPTHWRPLPTPPASTEGGADD